MPENAVNAPLTWPRRALYSLAALALAGLLLMAGHWASRLAFFPAPGGGPGGLLSQRYQGARLAGEPGPAQVETRTAMGDASDADFREHDFSLRLSGYLRVTVPGRYRLALESDDDGRLFLDGEKIIDDSGEHPLRLAQRAVWLGPGRHYYEVEYAQRTGGAGLRLLWAPPWGELAQLSPGRLVPAAAPLGREQAEALGYKARVAVLPLTALLLWGLALALAGIWLRDRKGLGHLALAGFILVLAMWVNSGTLAPYAAAQDKLEVRQALGGCFYLGNIDHQHFEAVYWMLDGDPVAKWSFSLVLRRILLPAFAYPFMKLWGFMEGGFLANLVVNLAMIISWAVFLRRRVGPRGSLWGTYGLALYPGIYFWSGLPYSYAFLVPGSIWAFMALWELGESDRPRAVLLWCAVLGVLFLGYDLWPFFLPAALLLILWRTRRPAMAALGLPALILPNALVIAALSRLGAYSAPLEKGHEPLAVLKSYIAPIDFQHWWSLLQEVPASLAATFFFGNYLFLPLLFLLLLAVGARRWGLRIRPAEACLLLSMAAVFLLNNLAPPYQGWQFRGQMYARFYQPLSALLLFFLARAMQAAGKGSWAAWPGLAALVLSAYVTFGPILGLPYSGYLHWRFGVGAGPSDRMEVNLQKYGRFPLGICPPCQVTESVPRPQGG